MSFHAALPLKRSKPHDETTLAPTACDRFNHAFVDAHRAGNALSRPAVGYLLPEGFRRGGTVDGACLDDR